MNPPNMPQAMANAYAAYVARVHRKPRAVAPRMASPGYWAALIAWTILACAFLLGMAWFTLHYPAAQGLTPSTAWPMALFYVIAVPGVVLLADLKRMRERALTRNGEIAEGVVTDTHGDATVSYEYVVAGQKYEGALQNARLREIIHGRQRVWIAYDPRKPTRSAFYDVLRQPGDGSDFDQIGRMMDEVNRQVNLKLGFIFGGMGVASLFGSLALAFGSGGPTKAAASAPPSAQVTSPGTPPVAGSASGSHRRTLQAAGLPWEIVDGDWRVENGDLVGGSGHVQTTSDTRDGALELDATMPDSPNATVGVGFRYSLTGDDPRASCGYGFNFQPSTESAVFEGKDGKWGSVGEGFRPTPALHAGSNHIVIRMHGSSFVIEANGQPVRTFTDARWPVGRVDFWVSTGTARFSNVHIH